MKIKVIVTISDKYVKDIEEIQKCLLVDGLIVHELFDFGIIIGEIEEENLLQVRQKKEILSVIEDVQYKINPPESEIQ